MTMWNMTDSRFSNSAWSVVRFWNVCMMVISVESALKIIDTSLLSEYCEPWTNQLVRSSY